MIYVNNGLELTMGRIDSETVTDERDRERVADQAVSAMVAVLNATDLEWEYAPRFRDWMGGKHHRRRNVGGLVAFDHEEEREAAVDAVDAFDTVIAQAGYGIELWNA